MNRIVYVIGIILAGILFINGCDFGSKFKITNLTVSGEIVIFEVVYNQEINVRDCNFIFISSEGNEHTVSADDRSSALWLHCFGTQLPGKRQTFSVSVPGLNQESSGTFTFLLGDAMSNGWNWKSSFKWDGSK